MSTRRLALIANGSKPGAAALVEAIRSEVGRQQGVCVLEERTAELVGAGPGVPAHALAAESDIVVVLGGDGTLLQAVHELGRALPPVCGINLGSLGFLTSVTSEAWAAAIESLLHGEYTLSARTLLEVELVRDGAPALMERALNDLVVSRGELSRLIRIDVLIGGARLSEYSADGLIVATPTGSTAYSLSAGGPVLAPESGVFVICPICPHVLTMRPVIVSEASVVEIVPACRPGDAFLTLDGQRSMPLRAGDRIVARRAADSLPLVLLKGTTFFEVLRQKLKWSGTAV